MRNRKSVHFFLGSCLVFYCSAKLLLCAPGPVLFIVGPCGNQAGYKNIYGKIHVPITSNDRFIVTAIANCMIFLHFSVGCHLFSKKGIPVQCDVCLRESQPYSHHYPAVYFCHVFTILLNTAVSVTQRCIIITPAIKLSPARSTFRVSVCLAPRGWDGVFLFNC